MAAENTKPLTPQEIGRTAARTEVGTFAPKYPKEARQQAVKDALERLENGETTASIASDYNVPERTLRSWLLADVPKEADEARARYFAGKIQEAVEEIERATEPLPLARGRELFRSWSWLAERRLPHLFAPKQELTQQSPVTINIGISKDRGVVIDGQKVDGAEQ